MGNAEKIVHPQRGISSCDAEHDVRNDASQIAQLQRAEGGSSSAKLSGLLRQPPAGRRSFVRRLEFGPRAAHARLPMVCRWLAADMPTVPMVSRS